jgi:uncharacterized membrane protein HdeD (DUF308 family)
MENNTEAKKGDIFIFLVIKALLAIGLGMGFLLNPEGMINTSSYIIGIVLIVYGVIESIDGFKVKKDFNFGQLIISDGIGSIIFGAVLIFWPNLGPSVVMVIIGLWILISSIIQLVIANKFKDKAGSRNVRGVLMLILGGLIIFNPSDSVQLVSMVIGGLSLIYGLYLLYKILRFANVK